MTSVNTSLNDKQIRFCDEYLVHFNATKAAEAAGYSKKTAYAQGCRLLKHAEVQKYLASKKKAVSTKLEISAERTLNEIAKIAYSDIRKFFDEGGTLKDIVTLDDDTAATVASVEIDELWGGQGMQKEQIGLTKKLKLWDKPKALDMLSKHFNLYKETPATVNNINLSNLDAKDLKLLLALMQKAGK